MLNSKKRIGYYIKNCNGTYDFQIFNRDFSGKPYEELKLYIDVIFKVQPILMSFEALQLNYNELFQTIEKYSAELLVSGGSCDRHLSNSRDCLIAFTQKVSNFLASATSFLSCSQVKLKNDQGEESENYQLWNAVRNELHKNNFSYRLLYELRNYSQHYNIPIGNINISTTSPIFEFNASITKICILKEELLSESYQWKHLKTEIETCEKEIDLMPLFDSYLDILKRITLEYLKIYNEPIIDCGAYLGRLVEFFKVPSNATLAVFMGEAQDGMSPPSNMEIIPLDQYNWIHSVFKELRRYEKT